MKRIINKIFKIIGYSINKYSRNILIKPTMICQLNCKYCIVNKTLGKRPIYDEVDYGKWIEFLSKRKPRFVTISGGEPFLYPNIHKIINYLTKKMVFVAISTNLMSLNGLQIKPSKFLWFYSTNHKSNQKMFEKNLAIYRLHGYSVSVKEYKERTIKGSRLGELKEKQTTDKIECYAPDLRKFNSWIEIESNGLKLNNKNNKNHSI